MFSQVLTAFVGFLFWYVATQLFEPADVGFASAVVSGITLVGAIGAMGLGTLLIFELPRHGGRELPVIAAALVAAAVFGGLFGLLFAIISPLLSGDLGRLRDAPDLLLTVVLGGALTATTLVIDQAVVGLLQSGLQLARNIIAAVARLALLEVVGLTGVASGALAMSGAWVAALGVSMLALVLVAGWRGSLPRAFPLQWDFLGDQWAAALRHHALNLGIQVPGWVMPIVAVAALSAETNAGFFMAWQLVGVAAFIHVALATMLYAAASRDPASLPRWGWLTFRLSLAASLLSAAGLWIIGPMVLEIFGPRYAALGREALLALPLTLFVVAIKSHYVTVHRVRSTVSTAAVVVTAAAAVEVVGAYVGARNGGLLGLGVGLLAAMVIESVAMVPTVYGAIIRPATGGRPIA